MHIRLLFPVVKTAGLYLDPVKSYSKNAHGHLTLKWTIVIESSFVCIIEAEGCYRRQKSFSLLYCFKKCIDGSKIRNRNVVTILFKGFFSKSEYNEKLSI